MKNLTALLLILQILCVSLMANAHSITADHDPREDAHYHLQTHSDITHGESNLNAVDNIASHDPSNHIHLSAIVLTSCNLIPFFAHTPCPNKLPITYLSQIIIPPVPPPNS